MTSVKELAALVVAAFGVVVALVVCLATRDVRAGILAGIELWTAAGLLHLTADAAWSALGSAAAVVAVRKLAAAGLRAS